MAEFGAPTEETVEITKHFCGRNVVIASEELKNDELKLLKKGLQDKALAENTVTPDCLDMMIKEYEEVEAKKEQA